MIHRHRWSPRSTTPEFHGFMADPATRVLYVCPICGKTKTKKIRGSWTIADLSAASDQEIERFLERADRE